jgi:hypothetical protein
MLDQHKVLSFFLLSALTLSFYSTDSVYLALLALIATFLVLKLFSPCAPLCVLSRAHVSSHASIFEYIVVRFLRNAWWMILLSWMYGIILALSLGVPGEHAFRNFFGLVVYIVSPILLCMRFSVSKLINLLALAAVTQLLAMAYFIPNSINAIASLDFVSLSELRVVYSLGTLIVLPLVAVSAASLFLVDVRSCQQSYSHIFKYINTKLGIVALLMLVIVPSMSKGLFIICVLFVTLPLIHSSAIKLYRGVAPVGLFVALVLFFMILLLLPQEILDSIFYTFSDEELSNVLRGEQFKYLVNEFSFLGSGLGSALKSGYARDDVSFYGFELNYLNIVHKLGIASLPLFGSYIGIVFLSLYRIFKGYRLFESYFALGLMGYLIQGIGNPILLSPVTVVMHCCSIHILTYSSRLDKYKVDFTCMRAST